LIWRPPNRPGALNLLAPFQRGVRSSRMPHKF
jgi:hypothetical protein